MSAIRFGSIGFSALLLVSALSGTGRLPALAAAADAAPASCAPATEGDTPTTKAMLSILSSIKAKDNLSAVIFNAERNGKPILRTAIGDSTPGVPATTDMHFRVGAPGWQFLSDVLLIMVDRKQISMDDPVTKWYPTYPHAEGATVGMLATSRTGFGDYIRPESFAQAITDDPFHTWTSDEIIARSLSPYQKPVFTKPGSNWSYSHTDFVMLGAILEKVSGKPYAELLKETILDPLGLTQTRLQLDAKPQLPILHTLDDGSFKDTTFYNPSFVSWAALTSNVCDLAKWNVAFGTGALLSPALKGAATAPTTVGIGGNTDKRYFGLGTLVYPPWIVQKASYWGMYTTTAYDPKTGLSLVVTAAWNPGAPPTQPTNEIMAAMSKLLTPDNLIPE